MRLMLLMLWLLLLLLLLMEGIVVDVVRGSIETMALRRRRGRVPRVCELGSLLVRHVVEVHAAEALLIVDSHCHLSFAKRR